MDPLDRGQVEVLRNSHSSGLPEPPAERRVSEQTLDRGREPSRIAGRDEQARLFVDDDLRHSANARGDNRKARRHRLEDREREPFGPARKHENVGCGEEFGDVSALTGELDSRLEAEAPNLFLHGGAIGPVADDHGLKRVSPQRSQGADERERVLGGLEAPDCHEPERARVARGGLQSRRSNAVADDNRRPLVTRAGREARSTLVVGHADGDRRQRTQEPLRPPVEDGSPPVVRQERPAVHRVDPDGHACEPGSEPAQGSRLRAVHVDDVRTLAAHHREEFEQAQRVAPEAERSPDVSERDEPHTGRPRGVPQRALAVGGYGNVEPARQRGEERCDVGLRPSGFGQRHDEQDSWTHRVPPAHQPEAYNARAAGALPFGLAAVAIFLWWAAEEGGYAPTAWYPGALVFLALLAVVAVIQVKRTSSTPWVTPAIGLLAAFTAWSFLSIAWAGVKGDAWDGANRTLLYLTVYATFAFLAWRTKEAAVVVGLFAVGTAAIGAAAIVSEGSSAFIGSRLAAPTGYANASAALFLAALWPAVALAACREVHWAARSLLLPAGGVLLQLALLAQSRASVVAGGTALLVYVFMSQARLRALLMLLLVAAVTLASLGPLFDVSASATETKLERAVSQERLALAVSTGALLAIGLLIGLVDRPGRLQRRALVPAARRRTAMAVVAAGGVLVALVAAAGISRLTHGPERPELGQGLPSALGSSRFTRGLGTGRYELWRVAVGEVADHPLIGVGADNFAVDFTRERRTDEEPLYPHSLLLRSFSQTGLVGGVLFLGFLGAALMIPLRRRGRSDALASAVASGTAAAASYWLVHGSIDWLWEIPALAAPALAWLGLVSGLGRTGRRLSTPRRPVAAFAAAGLVFAAAAGSLAFPGLAAHETEAALQAWPEAPDRAFSRLERARRLNPLSERPDVIAGTLAQRAGQSDRARAAFERALERDPNDWYVHLQLALLDAADGRQAQALDHLERARSLNPRGTVVERAQEALSGSPSARQLLLTEIDQLAVRSPLGRRPLDCRPVLGLARRCTILQENR
jgi:O-antigen ligase/polysaccharide polymerase Wzy-like membrane protein